MIIRNSCAQVRIILRGGKSELPHSKDGIKLVLELVETVHLISYFVRFLLNHGDPMIITSWDPISLYPISDNLSFLLVILIAQDLQILFFDKVIQKFPLPITMWIRPSSLYSELPQPAVVRPRDRSPDADRLDAYDEDDVEDLHRPAWIERGSCRLGYYATFCQTAKHIHSTRYLW